MRKSRDGLLHCIADELDAALYLKNSWTVEKRSH